MDILLRRDDDLLPLFYRALIETQQQYVARLLGDKGLHNFVMVFITLSQEFFYLCLWRCNFVNNNNNNKNECHSNIIVDKLQGCSTL